MMSEPMSEERLAELRELAEENRKLTWQHPSERGVVDAVDEIDRLRAEVKRLHQSVAGERMFKESERQWKEWASEAGAKVTQELEVMKTEVERLRGVLRDIAYNTSTSIPFAAPPETYIVGQLHSCIGRAARALNPEPSA